MVSTCCNEDRRFEDRRQSLANEQEDDDQGFRASQRRSSKLHNIRDSSPRGQSRKARIQKRLSQRAEHAASHHDDLAGRQADSGEAGRHGQAPMVQNRLSGALNMPECGPDKATLVDRWGCRRAC